MVEPRKFAGVRTAGAGLRKPGAATVRAPLRAFEKAPDPIDEKAYPGDIEGDAATELNQLQAGFIARMKAEQARFKLVGESGYYFVAVFETEEQCTAFIKAAGIAKKGSDLFVDGRELADKMGIGLPASDMRYNPSGKPSFEGLVRKPGDGAQRRR